jgi:hypothetical protein
MGAAHLWLLISAASLIELERIESTGRPWRMPRRCTRIRRCRIAK